jgi:hypothetical protein
MATEEIKRMISVTAGADLSTKRHYIAKLSAADTVVLCGLAERPLGVIDNEPASGASVALSVSGRVRVAAGAAIVFGQELMCDATGRAIPALDRDGWVIGIATGAAAGAGSEVSCLLGFKYQQKGVQQYIAGANLSAATNIGLLVKMGAADGKVILASVSGEQCLGVITSGGALNAAIMVQTFGRATVTSGAAITRGARLMTDASAKAIAATAFGGERIFGIALNSTAGADEDVDCLLIPAEAYDPDLTNSFVAGVSGTTEKCMVKMDTTDGQVVLPSAGDPCIGIALETGLAAASVRCQLNGIVTATSGAALTAGDRLEADAAGKVVTYTGLANRHVCGVALASAAGADEDVSILLVGPGGWEQDLPNQLMETFIAALGGIGEMYLVTAGAVDGEVTAITATTDVPIGVALSTEVAGDPVDIQFIGRVTAISGSAINAGQRVQSDGSGAVIPYTSDPNVYCVGIALETVGAGALPIDILLLPLGYEPDVPTELEYEGIAGVGGTTEKLFVIQSAVDDEVVTAGLGELCVGVAMSTEIAAAAVDVQYTGVAVVTSGAAVAAGDRIMSDAAGKAITADGVKGRFVVGVALTTVGAGNLDLDVLLLAPYPQLGATETRLFTGFSIPTGSTWTLGNDGTANLPANKPVAQYVCVPLSNLKVGETITKFRVVGALGASAGNHTVVDAILRKVTKGAGTVVDSAIDMIVQVDVQADTALDSEEALAVPETIATDYQYYVRFAATTANDPTCDIALIGVELDLTV